MTDRLRIEAVNDCAGRPGQDGAAGGVTPGLPSAEGSASVGPDAARLRIFQEDRPAIPNLLTGFDGEWSSYVHGHDEDALLQVDEPSELQWEKLWMREIPTAQAEDFGLYIDDPYYEGETCWVECAESDNGAEPWMGVKYAPID